MSYRSSLRTSDLLGPLTPGVRAILIVTTAFYLLGAVPVMAPLLGYLQLHPQDVLQRGYVWQLLTYMLLHGPPMHLVFNMLSLWWFGAPVESHWGTRRFVTFYLGVGLFAGLCTLLQTSPTIGASGAIFGVLVAFAMLYPDMTILFMGIFPMKAAAMAGLLIAIEFFMFLTSMGSTTAYACHLGGAAGAWLYLKHGWRAESWLRSKQAAVGSKAVPFRPPARDTASRASDFRARSGESSALPPTPRPAPPAATSTQAASSAEEIALQQQADAILDKISRDGLGSLTREERETLQRHSQRLKAREHGGPRA